MSARIVIDDENLLGVDYITGDIHGNFSNIEKALELANFDPAVDRLFLVGDFTSRGPESHKALEFLSQPWVKPVLGNHEAMILLLKHVNYQRGILEHIASSNGCGWLLDVDLTHVMDYADFLSEVPYMRKVVIGGKKVAIFHSEVNLDFNSFEDFERWVESANEDDLDYQLGVRDRFEGRRRRDPNSIFGGKPARDEIVSGVDRIYTGHNIILGQQRFFGNHVNLDSMNFANGIKSGAGTIMLDMRLTIPEIKSKLEFINGFAIVKKD